MRKTESELGNTRAQLCSQCRGRLIQAESERERGGKVKDERMLARLAPFWISHACLCAGGLRRTNV